MLLMSMLEKEENENGGVDGLLPLWRKKEKQSVERMVVKPAVTVVVAEGTTEKEKEESDDRKKRKRGEGGWFLSTLDSIFFML